MPNPIILFSPNNSLYISNPGGTPVLGQAPYGVYGMQPWQAKTAYQSKYLFTDELTIQVHSESGAGNNNQLYICDYYNPNSGDFRIIGQPYNTIPTIWTGINTMPYLKGIQSIAGNNFVDPFTNATSPLTSMMWAFSFNDLSITTPGIYYLLLQNKLAGSPDIITNLFSEPVLVMDTLRNTLLFQSQYATNKGTNINTVVTGWLNNFLTPGAPPVTPPPPPLPYIPMFIQRCEGYIIDKDPKAVNVGYLQQNWQQVQTYGQLVRMKSLKIGEISIGIPPHVLEGVTAQILSDIFWINNYSYICYNSSNSTSLSDLWKSRRHDEYPLLWAETMLMERFQGQGAIQTPPPTPPSHYFAPDYFAGGGYWG